MRGTKLRRLLRLLPLAAGLAMLLPGLASAQSPRPGTYAAQIYVAAASGGLLCPQDQGASYFGVVAYGGLNAATLTMHAGAASTGFLMQQVLTITNDIGTTTPEGTFTASAPGTGAVAGTFSAAFSLFDADSFTATVTETVPSAGCTEQFSIVLLRTGKR